MTAIDNPNSAFYVKPTIRQRIWWALGFCWKKTDENFEWRMMEPPEEGFAPGALHTETHVLLDWKDRLRVLVTGHIGIDVYTKTDVPVKRARSRSDVAVLPFMGKSKLVKE